MEIEFSAKDKPQEWFKTIARQFGATIVNDAFEIPASVGEGVFKQIYFFEGLTLTYFHLKLLEPLQFTRHSIPEAKLIPIMFYSQDIPFEQNIDEHKRLVGYHTSNGIFMPSSQIQSNWLVPSGNWGYQVTLTIEKDWFLKTIATSPFIYLNQLFNSDKSFYLFETLTSTMKQIICNINDLVNSDEKLQNLKLLQYAIELLNLFLCKVEQRTIIQDISGIHSSDIEAVFLIRKQILENLISIPSLKQLSIEAGMSISKLQKCFQQVFGKSISQYALSEKMNLARQKLDTKKYSVSEVGYQIGYSNLSHFSIAFKNEFGVNPKSYLHNL
ncbi:MAG: AraC family transcriptional regulator [Massilibacteroides sp.]|nr:AraC family transcriptional regulator [Massilibacteroides sp.]MDD3062237.1 AraC family transcriptional regulator [Massilibacteroides sp.]